MVDFGPGTRDFCPGDLEKLGLTDEQFGEILGAIEDGDERSDRGKREIFMIQYDGLRDYFVQTGVLNSKGEVDEERITQITIDYVSDRIRRRGLN